MSKQKPVSTLQKPNESPSQEVMMLADAVGRSSVLLSQVVRDFLDIVPKPIIAGGFAMAHHGLIRATVDIDVLAVEPMTAFIQKFKDLGYKHESLRLPIGAMDLLTKGNKGVDFIHLDNREFLASIQKRQVPGFFFDTQVHFVSLEDLILLKLLAVKGRRKKMDEADLETLLDMAYDKDYVAKMKRSLGLV